MVFWSDLLMGDSSGFEGSYKRADFFYYIFSYDEAIFPKSTEVDCFSPSDPLLLLDSSNKPLKLCLLEYLSILFEVFAIVEGFGCSNLLYLTLMLSSYRFSVKLWHATVFCESYSITVWFAFLLRRSRSSWIFSCLAYKSYFLDPFLTVLWNFWIDDPT